MLYARFDVMGFGNFQKMHKQRYLGSFSNHLPVIPSYTESTLKPQQKILIT